MAKNITTIAFDIGGVLGKNYSGAHHYIEEKTCIPANEVALRIAGARDIFRSTMRGRLKLEQYVNRILYATDWGVHPDYLDLLIKEYLAQPFPQSALEIALSLKSQGYRIAIFSDNNRGWIEYLHTVEAGKFLDHFDPQIYSYDLGALKTDEGALTRGFLKHGIATDEVLFIDDREPCIKAAARQEIAAIRYVNPFNLQVALARDYSIETDLPL